MRDHYDTDSGNHSHYTIDNEDEEFVVIECPITPTRRPLVTSTTETSAQDKPTDSPDAASNDAVQTDLETKNSLNSVPP